MSISADGNTALIGGYSDDTNIGATWIFTRSAGAWTEVSKLIGSGAVGAASQGNSVAISADASTTFVGGYLDDSTIGAAWIFVP